MPRAMYSTTSRYAGTSAEERRALRRRALLDAALDVVGEHGVAGLTMRGVTSRAGLNDRYFYENFTDCDQLATDLFDDQLAAAMEAVTTAIASSPEDPEARIRAVVTAAVAFAADDPRRGRLVTESQVTEGLRGRRSQFVHRLVDVMHAQVAELVGTDAVTTTTARLSLLTVADGELDLLIHWLRSELDPTIDRAALTEFLITTLRSVVSDLARASVPERQ
ncbi:TetR/AcrR family transcriptional regulator [Nocardia sp. NPDC059228]|uniref:TetR/AcrR family transcriptional regulator n=1 Tax=Nocardia sp. NPDC059228 TaxID=3346777 RepID=UPI0036A05D1D